MKKSILPALSVLLTTTAIGFGAYAADTTQPMTGASSDTTMSTTMTAKTDQFAEQNALFPAGAYSAEELIGLNVKNAAGEDVAKVSDIILDSSGAAKHIILTEGGIMGVGGRSVAVPATAVKPVMANNMLDHAMLSSADLLPLSGQKEFRYETAMNTSGSTANPTTAPATPATADPVSPPPAGGIGNVQKSPDGSTTTTEPGDAMTPDKTAQTTPEVPATGGTPSTSSMPGDATMTTASASGDFVTLQPGETSADRLIDSDVRNAQGETVGTIEDITLTSDNKAANAIISVGSFLGGDAKYVALTFSDLQVAQSGSSDATVTAQLSRDQLQAAPNVTARGNGSWGG